MMSPTPLAEPEKRELEWESRWGQLKRESQQFEARWEKMMQQLRNIIVPKPSGVVAVADNEFNFESLVEEVDLQYEARRKQSEARFHERIADTDPHTFVPLPQVIGQGSVSLESHDGEWIVQRSTAATYEHADSHESHEKEGEPIGELFLSCNITVHHPLEAVLTPWQETEKLELSIPLPSEPYVLSSSLASKDYLRVENSRKESVEFGAQNQGILILPPARENAQLKELVISLPTPVYCNFASKWLLECDHKPKVKMKCRVDCVEFYSKFSHHCNSVSLGLLWRCASKLEACNSLVTSISSQDYFSEIFDIGSSRHGMDSVGGVVEQLSGVVEEESMMLRKDAIGNFEEFGKYSNFSLQFCLNTKVGGGKIDHGQVKNGMELEQNQLQRIERLSHARQNAPVRKLTVVLPISAGYSLSLSWLLNWFPRPKVKMKTKEVELGDLISTLTQELGEGIQFVDDASRFLSDKITRAEIGILVGKKHGGKREEDPLHGDMSFDRCFCIDEGIEQLEQLGSLCNHYMCQGRFYIDEGLERVDKLETLFVKVDHLFRYNFQLKSLWILVRIRFWTKTGPWLESSLIRTFHLGCLHFALFLLTMTCFLPSLRTRKFHWGECLYDHNCMAYGGR